MKKVLRKRELSSCLRYFRVGARQACSVLENGSSQHKTLAVKVVDKLATLRAQIEKLVGEFGNLPSAWKASRIKQLQKQQRKHLKGFAAAIKLGDIKSSRVTLGFLIKNDAELSELLEIEKV